MSCYCCYDREDREYEEYESQCCSTISWDEEEEAARWADIQEAWDNYRREELEKEAEQEQALREEAQLADQEVEREADEHADLQDEALREAEQELANPAWDGVLARSEARRARMLCSGVGPTPAEQKAFKPILPLYKIVRTG